MPQKTHRKVNNPQISARLLADFMSASEQARRTIIRNCKYQPIARVIQHDEAKLAISSFIRGGTGDLEILNGKAADLRKRFTTDEFERDLFDHNAEYIESFVTNYDNFTLPDAEILAAGNSPSFTINGVKVTNQIAFRLRRVTRTNRGRIGFATLRYAKGKPLNHEIANWQSAFIYGIVNLLEFEDSDEPEQKLCITLDGYTGMCHAAPSDSTRRFKNMEAACASIAERWMNIEPPANAVF